MSLPGTAEAGSLLTITMRTLNMNLSPSFSLLLLPCLNPLNQFLFILTHTLTTLLNLL